LGFDAALNLGSGDKSDEAAWAKVQAKFAGIADARGSNTTEAPAVAARTTLEDLPNAAWYQAAGNGTLTLRPIPSGLGTGRWLLALAIAGAWGLAWRTPKRLEPLLITFRRWPAVLGVIAGLFWWAYLTPTLLGPAIVALSLAALVNTRRLHERAK
jgi:hypothetical protein